MSLNKTDSDDGDVSLTKSDVVLTFNMEVSLDSSVTSSNSSSIVGCCDGSTKFKISSAK